MAVELRVVSGDGSSAVREEEACECACHRLLRGEVVDLSTLDGPQPLHGRKALKSLSAQLGEAVLKEDWQACLNISYRLQLVTQVCMYEAARRLRATRAFVVRRA